MSELKSTNLPKVRPVVVTITTAETAELEKQRSDRFDAIGNEFGIDREDAEETFAYGSRVHAGIDEMIAELLDIQDELRRLLAERD